MRIYVKKRGKKRVAYVIGRFEPLTMAHLLFFMYLNQEFDEVVIGIGSCFNSGEEKYPFLAVFREKMILLSLVLVGIPISKFKIYHLQDFKNNWIGWWNNVIGIPGIEEVTHFVTGNEEEIILPLKKLGIKFPFKHFNPEKELPKKFRFPHHAKDLRKAVQRNDYEMFKKIAAPGTIALMGNVGGFSGIREALMNNGIQFIPGRQTVDLVITCRSKKALRMLLCGKRRKMKRNCPRSQKKKMNFPDWLATPGGAINNYESPMDAAVRECEEETGLHIEIVNRHFEPAHVLVNGILSEMRFVKLFSTNDERLAGKEGGSSQVFHIDLDVTPEAFRGQLKSKSDLKHVAFRPVYEVLERGLAYQQGDMVKTALGMR
jgi:nicotinamide mononucleotide adenylyltransferase/8-oxo-dGTP pyrophosphatase MutT (NUDIX family)